MNIFKNQAVANEYDSFYRTNSGKLIDELEKYAIEQLISDIKPCPMLEIGCGTGHWTKFFSDKGFSIIAIDNSQPMLTIAQLKAIPNTEFIFADAEHLPFESNSFDFIATIATLEFVNNVNSVVNEIKRLISSKGTILIGTLNPQSLLFKDRKHNSVFKDACLKTKAEWLKLLSPLGKISYTEAVYVTEKHDILQHSTELSSAFVAFKIVV